METIPKDNCVKIGFVRKTHGIHGEVVIQFENEYYETLEECPPIFLEIDQLLVPYFISGEELRFKSGESVIVKLEWIDSDKQAKELCGKSVYVDRSDVVVSEHEMSPSELVGFSLYDESSGLIGEIEEINDFSGNLLLSVDYRGQEVLVPLNEDLIISLDEEDRKIIMQLPDGLLDLNEE